MPNSSNADLGDTKRQQSAGGNHGRRMELPRASHLFGPNPTGHAADINLAVRNCVKDVKKLGVSSVVVACSGGPDSLAVAAASIDCCAREGVNCYSVTVDHGLREGSDKEARDVAQLLRDLGIQCAHIERIDIDQQHLGPEGAARHARYQAIEGVATRYGTLGKDVAIFLGHTCDDQAETVLLGFGRGAGAPSLQGMRYHSGAYWRPVLGLRRADTVATCATLGLPTVDDPTNRPDGSWRAADGTPLRRAAIRHHVIPLFNESMGADIVPALARTASRLQDDDDALSLWASHVFEQCAQCQNDSVYLPVDDMTQLPKAVMTRVIRHAIEKVGCPPGRIKTAHIDAVSRLFTHWHGQKPGELPNGVIVQRLRDDKVVVLHRQLH